MTVRCPPAQPFFLPVGAASPARRVFCLHHAPVGEARGAIVHVPAFAEEMNKSRRMVALAARALAADGWHVLQLDLFGSGDSDGDFGDASWAGWLDDIAAARSWLADACGHTPWLWGLRLGALLAAASLVRQPLDGGGLLLWQPVLSGKPHLQQFLRLSAGAQWLNEQAPAVDGARAAAPLDQLRSGQSVEVAGYLITPTLALPMADSTMQWTPGLARIVWFEVSPRAEAGLAPASERLLLTAPAGCVVQQAVVRGPSFWQSQEIETAPALLAATCEALAA